MNNLKNIISTLESKELVTTDDDSLQQIYKGTIRRPPYKVMNPDPNIEYSAVVEKIIGEDGKYIFHHVNGKDVYKSTNQVKSIHINFDIKDIYSPLESKRKSGRFSFQYEDLTKSKNKPNYRRILFFYADDTNPKRISDYFKGANKIDFEEKGFYILSQTNKNANQNGLAFIFNYKAGTYYFANFDDGELEGFAFKFTSSGDSYVFEDAFVFHKGKKTNLYVSTINQIKKAKENGNQTVISWS